MWFRPGSSSSTNADSDRFRVSSFKNRIRGRKTKSVGSEYPSKEQHHVDEVDEKSKSVDDELLLDECGGKEKVLLTDPKYKNNRIAKSSSKGKICAEIECPKGKCLHVVMAAGRKISAPPILDPSKSSSGTTTGKKSQRAHSNLNLNALLRYTLANANKRLSSEEFDRIRRKSLSDSSVGGTTSSNKLGDDVINPSDEAAGDVAVSQSDELKSGMDGQEVTVTLKSVSPKNSLTSRVAAKLSESTGRSKKSKGKKRKGTRRQSSGSALNVLCDRPLGTSVTRQPSDRRPDSGGSSHHHHHSHGSVGSASGGVSADFQSPSVADVCEAGAPVADRPTHDGSKSKSAPVSVNRSESYKERLSHKRNRTNRRKTSDPSLTKTK
uniref:Uncharacterized protein n=1 Tax=Lutzomyia longipalpis TaxID=7200 RepID=A0A1B0CTZ1_LUTLO